MCYTISYFVVSYTHNLHYLHGDIFIFQSIRYISEHSFNQSFLCNQPCIAVYSISWSYMCLFNQMHTWRAHLVMIQHVYIYDVQLSDDSSYLRHISKQISINTYTWRAHLVMIQHVYIYIYDVQLSDDSSYVQFNHTISLI